MLSLNRTYPLDPDCTALTADKNEAARHYGKPVCLVNTLLPEIYETLGGKKHPVMDNPVFKKYQALLARHEKAENDLLESEFKKKLERADKELRIALKERGAQTVSLNVSSIYETNVFQLIPRTEGIRLSMQHWSPAPQYPAASNASEVTRRRKTYATRSDVTKDHQHCYGLKRIALNPKYSGFDAIVKKYENTPALDVEGDYTFLSYWEIPERYPVARSAKSIDFTNLNYASNSDKAAALAESDCIVSEEFLGRTYVKRSTAQSKFADLLKYGWVNIAQDSDDKWGALVRFWMVMDQGGKLTAMERKDLERRVNETLRPNTVQDFKPFGIFSRFENGVHAPEEPLEEGTGRRMGL